MTGALLLGDACLPNVETLIAKRSIRAGPRQKSAHSIEYFLRGPRPIDDAVFLLQNGRKRGFSRILFRWWWILAERSNQKLRARCGQPLAKLQRIFFRPDFRLPFEQHVTGVEPSVDAHGGDSGSLFAVRNGPLNRCRAAILRQQRSMHIDN